MCGICGYLNFNHLKYASSETIQRMSNALIHRGPDEYGHFEDRGLGLGVRRLSIIDPLMGHQPMTNEDRTLIIVFNGEIYNFQEIRKTLKDRHDFKSRSDTEVLLHLYEEKKYEMLHELNGMFSFAIWDKKNEVLFCARDRAGQKPFYYTLFNGYFIFASELKSILLFSRDINKICLGGLKKYLAYGYIPSPDTIFKEIKKLPAGHFLTISSSGNLHIQRYWKINFNHREARYRRNIDEKEICHILLRLFKNSVKRHLVSDVPVGIFLSGGIDSSAIVSMVSEFYNSKDIKTFTIGFNEDSFDESAYAKEVADYFKTDHKTVVLTSEDMLKVLPEIIKILDEPFSDASIIPTYILSKFARKYIKVALSGDGGDELFAGYPTLQGHRLAQWIRFLPSSLLKNLLGKVIKYIRPSFSNYSLDFVIKQFLLGLGHKPEIMNQIWLGPFDHESQKELLNESLGLLLTEKEVYEDIFKHMDEVEQIMKDSDGEKDGNIINRILEYYFKFYLQDDILAKVDRASMANSLEVRSPFLDKDFIEYVSSLESHLKLNGFTAKYIFKMAIRDKLPQEIIRRQKRGFTIPIANWFKNELRDILTDVLNPKYIKSQGLFNPLYVKTLIKDHLNGKKDNQRQLWALFIFELWQRDFLKRRIY